MVLLVGAAYGIPSVAVRFFNVFGEPEISFERGMEHVLTWLEEREVADTVEAAHAALVARGLAR
jgi:nucleoside-diphosphate-sugar epimerase